MCYTLLVSFFSPSSSSTQVVLEHVIGEGSFGRVWAASWHSSKVAVKEFVFAQAAVAAAASSSSSSSSSPPFTLASSSSASYNNTNSGSGGKSGGSLASSEGSGGTNSRSGNGSGSGSSSGSSNKSSTGGGKGGVGLSMRDPASMRRQLIEEIVGEAGLMSYLRHPRILQLFGCSLTAQAIWIVSELCALGSLRQVITLKSMEVEAYSQNNFNLSLFRQLPSISINVSSSSPPSSPSSSYFYKGVGRQDPRAPHFGAPANGRGRCRGDGLSAQPRASPDPPRPQVAQLVCARRAAFDAGTLSSSENYQCVTLPYSILCLPPLSLPTLPSIQGGPGTFHVKIGDWGSARAVALRSGTSLRSSSSSSSSSSGAGGGGRQRSMTRGVGTVSTKHLNNNPYSPQRFSLSFVIFQ